MTSTARSMLALLALAALLPACRDEDPQPTADGGVSDVARCIALARSFRDACAASNGQGDDRVCLWEGYAELCETGNTALLIASMECLDAGQCRTFSDANDGEACLDALHASQQPPALRQAIVDQCESCGGTGCAASSGRAEILPYLPVSAAPALGACAGSACTLEGIVGACADEIAPLAAFQCGAPELTGDVTRCVALAENFRARCAASNGEGDVRVCLWEGYAQLCRTGDTALLIDAMDCLDQTQCRTFSDANEGGACLDALHTVRQPAAIRGVIEGRCNACGGSGCGEASGRAEILPYLLAGAAPALETCAASACSIDDIVADCAPTVAPLAAFQCGE